MQNHVGPQTVQKEIRNRLKAKPRQPAAISLGRFIAQERARQGLTQHELARAVDCPDVMISYLETDRRTYWVKLREIIEFLAPRAERLWLKHCTETLKGQVIATIEDESDPVKRLLLAEWLRSSGDRATATSLEASQSYLPGFMTSAKEPNRSRPHAA